MQHFFHFILARLPPDEDPAVESGRVMRPIQVGEEVLARWSDEGWYYRGNINLASSSARAWV